MAKTTYICTKDGLKNKSNLVYWQSSVLKKWSLNKSFSQDILQKYCHLHEGVFEVICFYSTAATPVFHSAALSLFSPHVASTEKLRGKKQRESICHDIAVLPFPCRWLLYIERNQRSVSPSAPFHSSPPMPLKRAPLEAARATAYYLEIQSCIFLVTCADGKTGKRTIISEHPATQRISWIPWATNRWITKCFTML